ncbi:MAG: calcium/sodium antiporter [Pirellulales bacterium]|nr:calcium/sodium antiporter [Pirellulales bacterium]
MLETLFESFNDAVQHIDSPLLASVTLLIGVVLLLVGGKALVSGSVRLAKSLGVSTLIVGLTVVAFGTSAPELAFNLIAAINGNTDLSFGNVVGSNIANVGLVMGLSAITAPLVIKRRVFSKELPWLIAISLGTLALAFFPPDVPAANGMQRGFARLDGGIYLLVFGGFVMTWFRMARRDARSSLLLASENEINDAPAGSLLLAGLLVLSGLVMLAAGGKGAEIGAVKLAEMGNIRKEVIGLTIVAFATSLPEAIASVTACRSGHTDLAVGNVIGSNIFNLVLVLGTTCVVKPVALPISHAWTDLLVMTGLTMTVLLLAWWRDLKIERRDGWFLLSAYLLYWGFLGFRTLT